MCAFKEMLNRAVTWLFALKHVTKHLNLKSRQISCTLQYRPFHVNGWVKWMNLFLTYAWKCTSVNLICYNIEKSLSPRNEKKNNSVNFLFWQELSSNEIVPYLPYINKGLKLLYTISVHWRWIYPSNHNYTHTLQKPRC